MNQQKMFNELGSNFGAEISADEKYRYKLWRIWEPSRPLLLWIMLNPSTADGSVNDPTIRRCIDFTAKLGYGGMFVGNLFAYRATKPAVLYSKKQSGFDVVGPENISAVKSMAAKCSKVVIACGNGFAKSYMDHIGLLSIHPETYCLGRTKDGSPRHPLYVKGGTELKLFSSFKNSIFVIYPVDDIHSNYVQTTLKNNV